MQTFILCRLGLILRGSGIGAFEEKRHMHIVDRGGENWIGMCAIFSRTLVFMICKTDGKEKTGGNEFEVNLKVHGKKERTKQYTLKGRIVCTWLRKHLTWVEIWTPLLSGPSSSHVLISVDFSLVFLNVAILPPSLLIACVCFPSPPYVGCRTSWNFGVLERSESAILHIKTRKSCL